SPALPRRRLRHGRERARLVQRPRPASRARRGQARAGAARPAPDARARALDRAVEGAAAGPLRGVLDEAQRRLPSEPRDRADGGGVWLRDRSRGPAREGRHAPLRGAAGPGAAAAVAAAGGKVVVLDDVGRDAWRPYTAPHWPEGLHAARLFTDGACVVQTMCCKTHRFGGHVTLALKNTVGLVAKHVPGLRHDFMRDLHGSPHQRGMIAEANLAWRPALGVMDCLEAFVDGGPERGTRAAPGVFLASDDRC